MIYRSTNPEGYVHMGGDIMSGANSTRGVLLSSNTVSPTSDNTNEALILKGKGTGGVMFGTSTSALSFLARGTAVAPTVELPASAIVYSTITIPGAVAGDVLVLSRSTAMSTALAMGGAYVSAANEGTFAVLNNLASTASIVAGPFPFLIVR